MIKRISIALFVLLHIVSIAQINMNIDMATPLRRPISPYIYGLNAYVYQPAFRSGLNIHQSQANIESMNVTSWRIGGNSTSAFNWENGANNSGNDDMHKNSTFQTFIATGLSAAAAPAFYTPNIGNITTQNHALQLGAAALIQLPSAGYVAADVTQTTCGTPTATPTRWKEVVNNKPTALSLVPDLSDNAVYNDECINHLINQFGNSTTANGIKFYQTDNEIGLWCLRATGGGATGTHAVMRNNSFTTCTDVLNRTQELAKTIKRMDPSALVFTAGIWNYIEAYSLWSNYDGASYQPSDWATYNVEPYKTNNTGNQYRYNQMTWQNAFLANMKLWEQSNGKRLIDVLSFHYYPQENLTNTNRFHNPRSLWDSSFVENSWLTQMGNGLTEGRGLRSIPLTQRAINDFYPGTKIAITEYDFYGNNHISGALAQADALGIFGRFDIFLATYFGIAENYISSAFKIYRNYDGNKSTFGNTYIPAGSDNYNKSSVYASIHDANENKLHIILINKSLSAETMAVNILNSAVQYGELTQAFGIGQADGTPMLSTKSLVNTLTGNSQIVNNKFEYSMPAYSIIHLVVSPSKSNEKDILTFTIPNQVGNSNINAANASVDLVMPAGTNLNSLVPSFTMSPFATSNPNSGVAQNFSNPFIYTNTAQNGTTKSWTVRVTNLIRSSLKDILTFTIPNQVGNSVISNTTATVDLMMPAGTNLNSLTPNFTMSPLATSNPNSGIAQNFSNPVIYTLTAEDGSTQPWTVKLASQASSLISDRDSENIFVHNLQGKKMICVRIPSKNLGSSYSLVSTGGQICMQGYLSTTEDIIDMTDFPQGKYFIIIQSKNEKIGNFSFLLE